MAFRATDDWSLFRQRFERAPSRPLKALAYTGCAAFALLLASTGPLLTPDIAQAFPTPSAALLKHNRQVSYPMNQVWPTAIRYLRVERGYQIEDKDLSSGYILFSFPYGNKVASGSLEFLEGEDTIGRPAVTMISSIQLGPSHLPYTLLDGIATKLREERGQPRTPPPQTPPEDGKPPEEKPDDTVQPTEPDANPPG